MRLPGTGGDQLRQGVEPLFVHVDLVFLPHSDAEFPEAGPRTQHPDVAYCIAPA